MTTKLAPKDSASSPEERSRLPQSGARRPLPQRLRFALFVGLIGLCFIGGGASRDDAMSLLYLRPAAILLGAAMLLLPGPVELRAVRVPLFLFLALAAVMALQLVPLPPDLWTALPGRASFAEAMNIAGAPQPWRPVSIAPDLTLNSLASMVVPLAALLGFATLDREQRLALLPVLLAAAFLSALLGMAQMAGGESSWLRPYRITNRDSAVGLFANRNHQAALLAIAFPMLAVWAATSIGPLKRRGMRLVVAAGLGVFLVPTILVTGSRAGLVLGGLAAACAWLLYVNEAPGAGRRFGARRTTLLGVAAILLMTLLFSYAAFQRAESLQRVLEADFQGEGRWQNLGLLTDLATAQLPLGSGFGTFDPLFRIHEPLDALSPFYLNHAHNDLLELAITGGAPGLLLLLAAMAWLTAGSVKAFRPRWPRGAEVAHARLGAVAIALLLVWSLVDYPLRTPFLATVLAIAAGWLGGSRAVPPPPNADEGRST